MTLARRMWLASAVLAVLVGAAFTALVVAVSAQREATEREARSKDVTVASLQLEKLVSDAETGFLGFTVTRRDERARALLSAQRASCPARLRVLQSLVADDPTQRPGCKGWRARSGGTSITSSPRCFRCCVRSPA